MIFYLFSFSNRFGCLILIQTIFWINSIAQNSLCNTNQNMKLIVRMKLLKTGQQVSFYSKFFLKEID